MHFAKTYLSFFAKNEISKRKKNANNKILRGYFWFDNKTFV